MCPLCGGLMGHSATVRSPQTLAGCTWLTGVRRVDFSTNQDRSLSCLAPPTDYVTGALKEKEEREDRCEGLMKKDNINQ
ncbi:hypothetical protein EYF80_011287 [Liparis tanakae]|uniref:Uncharacterized protein n=1 Tax=Liparis tanakae TaxID=230148 RepID=A0A4Z2IM11_9TELE|nr:hypothetical protein EYF80_011287 [Liparis tanakae]